MLAAGYPSVDEYNSNNQYVPTTDKAWDKGRVRKANPANNEGAKETGNIYSSQRQQNRVFNTKPYNILHLCRHEKTKW